ncbi:MAG: hypothetical protein AMXMBFR4_30240 [Candidatus Hydrogenedentota bacterium]
MKGSSPEIRRRARERAMQFLFGIDFTSYEWRDAIERFWRDNPSKNSVRSYADSLIQGVMDHRAELDERISSALDKWAPDRVGRVERNVLRIALFEMCYKGDVPRAVAINEAIEVAKQYGADDAGRFVNGVLDRIKDN